MKNKARTFGQDLMRGEHIVGGAKMKKTHSRPGGSGDRAGRAYSEKYKGGNAWAGGRKPAKAIGDTDWVNSKQADGELGGGLSSEQTGTSIFDPVLTELAYTWFCPKDGHILDPFAGGSVRGIVASALGRDYTGVELRFEQVDANIIQGVNLCSDPKPEWIVGDSVEIDTICKGRKFDMIFSCPPYADLEVYSENPADISTMEYDDFLIAYREIIKKACALLKQDRFACFVVGEVRDKKGNYRNFVGDTVEAFRAAGLEYYNEAILVTAVGSLPIRVTKQFNASRKLGKTHQNVLVFVKGDGKKATKSCGEVAVYTPDKSDVSFGEEL